MIIALSFFDKFIKRIAKKGRDISLPYNNSSYFCEFRAKLLKNISAVT